MQTFLLDCTVLTPGASQYEELSADEDVTNGRRFTRQDINTKRYYQEVKNLIVHDMGISEELSPIHYSRFLLRFDAKKGTDYKLADPSFDAWMCVLGRERDVFDCKSFIRHYRAIVPRIRQIRKSCNVSLRITCSPLRYVYSNRLGFTNKLDT